MRDDVGQVEFCFPLCFPLQSALTLEIYVVNNMPGYHLPISSFSYWTIMGFPCL